jgi:hydroxymethylpyrimidine pyrophosphatase-like HAD family hydrolase
VVADFGLIEMIISQDHPVTNPQNGVMPCGLFVMDFDGTLLRTDRTVGSEDLAALQHLGELGFVRAIATGRSLYSFNTVPLPKLPMDFVIFSTGAGILQYNDGEIIRKVNLEPGEVDLASEVLKTYQLDFMIHHIIPDNHRFAYHRTNLNNDDFDRRLALYRSHADILPQKSKTFGPATQLLAVLPARSGTAVLESIRNELVDFSVIQTTSPLDGESTWIEIFPASVSKSQTAAWLAAELQIDQRHIISVGNDYNDLDLLEWTHASYVVDNAPADLKNRFATVASNDKGGVAEAARKWLAKKGQGLG